MKSADGPPTASYDVEWLKIEVEGFLKLMTENC
jgi:hypothetical protein